MAATYTSTYLATVSGSLVPTATQTFVAPLAAPSGYVVDFDDPQRKAVVEGYWVFAVGIIWALAFLVMRVFVKVKLTPPLNYEDVFLVVGWIIGLVCQILFIYMWIHRIHGLHAWEMSVHHFNIYNILIIVGPALFALCQFFSKFSILLFYHRLAPIPWFRVSVYLLMFVFTGYTISIIAIIVFPCTPIAMTWDYTITDGHCINRALVFMAPAIVNIVGELALLLVPMPILMKLQMPLVQKVGLFCMFAVGMLTCITSVIRLVVLLPILTSSDRDRPWTYSVACIWIIAEANLVTVCGCLPVAKKFLRHVAPRLIGESSSSSTMTAYARNCGSTQLQTIGTMRSRPFTKHARRQKYGAVEAELEADEAESEQGGQRRAWSDGGSETAIVVTKRTTIEYGEPGVRFSGYGQPRGFPDSVR